MRQKKLWFAKSAVLATLAAILMLSVDAGAVSKFKILHRFKAGADGNNPRASLIFDAAGNLYGTTAGGAGTGEHGTVFELVPNADGSWIERALYRFCSVNNCADGYNPLGGLIFDVAGNLYGTIGNGCLGDGGVFKLAPNPDGSWTESVLHSFVAFDGAFPLAGLIFDQSGNLYGTTNSGGDSSGSGTIFELAPNSDGSWTESVLYSFTNGTDGAFPDASLIFDAAGNLYGATAGGGDNAKCDNCGTVFELTPHSDGSWTEHVLHRFTDGRDGRNPYGSLIFDPAGNLYGTNAGSGDPNCRAPECGVVFRLDTNGKLSVVHAFANHRGVYPYAGLTFDATGNLYGTTVLGGSANGGVVFKLAPNSDGSWRERVLHNFLGKPAMNPYGGLVLDKAGNVYGTASGCGDGIGCYGVVFQIIP